MPRTILLTGATGFVGRHLTERFVAAGHDVIAAVRRPAVLQGPSSTRIDLDRQSVARGIAERRVDTLVHVAGLINGPAKDVCVANQELTSDIMNAIADSQCRPDVLFLSSVSAITRFGAYGEAKYRAEEIIAERAPARWIALRSSLIHGHGDTKNVGMLIRAVRRWPAIPVVGVSTVTLQPLYVHDLADAFMALLAGSGVPSTRYIVSGPRQERLIDMIRMIQSRVGRRAPLIPIPLEPVRYTVALADRLLPFLKLPVQQIQAASNHPPYQFEAAQRDLGFNPRSFEDAIADYLQAS